MKDLNLTEKIGMALGIIGAIMIILDAYIEGSTLFKEVLGFNQIVFWLGVLLWAFGKIQADKKSKEVSEN